MAKKKKAKKKVTKKKVTKKPTFGIKLRKALKAATLRAMFPEPIPNTDDSMFEGDDDGDYNSDVYYDDDGWY